MLGRDGLILTNQHVIQGPGSLIATTANGTGAALRILTSDRQRDLALLQATSTLRGPAPLRWAGDEGLGLGEPILVLGNPFPSSQSPNDCSESITVTRGILSGRLDIRGQAMLQTDAPLNSGVSGDLAVTDTGAVAGLAVSRLESDVAESVGFLIPASAIEARLAEWLPQLEAGTLEPPPALVQIAFASERDGNSDIYIMDADGGNVRQLTDSPEEARAPAWSPDGSQIAFASGPSLGTRGVYVMNADGSNVRLLTNRAVPGTSLTWSPDGTEIAFERLSGYGPGIYVMNADGGNVRQLTDAWTSNLSPDWSPDGTQIAFSSFDIYVMDADGGNLRRLTDGSGSDWAPAWSPDGTHIAFSRDGDIYVMDADGGNLRRLTDDQGIDFRPAWSPDGRWIAFDSNRDGDWDIYVMDANGGNVVQLTDDPETDTRPAWSPVP